MLSYSTIPETLLSMPPIMATSLTCGCTNTGAYSIWFWQKCKFQNTVSPAYEPWPRDWIPDQAREDILEKNSPGGDPGPRKDPLFSLIISNPPYVTEDEYTQIDADVARWEDKSALVADDNGLAFYKKITSLAPQYLATGGMLVFEIGTTQDTKVTALMEATGLTDVTVHQDSFGHNRWVVGKRS